MNWFWKMVDLWSARRQQKELISFLRLLQSMSGSELGHIIALATNVRHALKVTDIMS